jgi:hypothetical protein
MIPLIIGVFVGYLCHDVIHKHAKQIGRKIRHKQAAAQTRRWARKQEK